MADALDKLSLDRLEADIARLAVELTRQLAHWLMLVAEFDRRGGARRSGFRGTSEWLAWRCGLSRRAARDHVRVARGLRERPLVRSAFATGELSYSKLRAITRAPACEDEAALLDLARSTTAAHLERKVSALRSAPSAGMDVAVAGHARRFVEWWWEPDGSLSLRARLPADDGAAFVETVETAAAAMHEPAPGAELPPPLGARRADALAEIVVSGAPRAQVVVHVDPPALACTAEQASERQGDVCRLESGPAIPSETARRLACDAELVVARSGGDGASDYGRRRRVVPPALRNSLERRDEGCRFPGCDRRHDLHAHHVTHWAHGGRTNRDNLVLLCRFHHRLVHEDGFFVRRLPGGDFAFSRPDGRVIDGVPSERGPLRARAPSPARAERLLSLAGR